MKKKFSVQVLVLLMVVLLVAAGVAEAAVFGSRMLQQGVRGDDVAELQLFLNEQGYRVGNIDGVFGPLTYGGVIGFQEEHGLLVDGIVGNQTFGMIISLNDGNISIAASAPIELQAVDNDSDEFNFSAADLDLFARIVHAEAAGETFQGQVAVAASIINRIRSTRYPNTMPGVVNQKVSGYFQYSPVLDGRINRPAGESAKKAIQEALNGNDPSNGALGFYNPAKTSNQWVRSQPVTTTIGRHVFFK
ncbi:MAG: cell wall hydrolase [Clostridiales bacterium]|jgi:N-acetylmuramoyl-L-alanine amidase|nr:cell wall hydrolase [Clostridiales bacterium]